MKDKTLSRRQFAATASTLIAGTVLGGGRLFGMPNIVRNLRKPNSLINGVQIGVITYSFRSLKNQNAEATLQYVLDCGISAIELMGGPAEDFAGAPKSPMDFRQLFPLYRKRRKGEELTKAETKMLAEAEGLRKAYNETIANWRTNVPMDKFEQMRKMYADAGVSIYAFKPGAFGKNNTDGEIAYGMKAAKALGASHITLEHPSDDAHTLKLGQMAEQYGVQVAYHGHTQQTPTFWDTALEQSPANALNLDLGHYVAGGNAKPLKIIRKKHERILSMHMKDRRTPENNQTNMPWGSGDTPLVDALRLMRKKKYTFPGTIELEYQIPEGSDAIAEVQNCLEFCREALK